jgi:acetyl esterase/lipase
MDRAVCVVGWAQAHAADYGASAEATTVAGYSGGAMAAAWAGLGLANDAPCLEKMTELPVGLVLGESQFLFHHSRWDPAFMSGDPEPKATLDGLLNPQRWNVSPDLRVALWSSRMPLYENRTVENPPAEDSWIWLREAATPVVDDLIALGAFDDERFDFVDNALLMESRMKQGGIDVQSGIYEFGHEYTEEVFDLIFSIQP